MVFMLFLVFRTWGLLSLSWIAVKEADHHSVPARLLLDIHMLLCRRKQGGEWQILVLIIIHPELSFLILSEKPLCKESWFQFNRRFHIVIYFLFWFRMFIILIDWFKHNLQFRDLCSDQGVIAPEIFRRKWCTHLFLKLWSFRQAKKIMHAQLSQNY